MYITIGNLYRTSYVLRVQLIKGQGSLGTHKCVGSAKENMSDLLYIFTMLQKQIPICQHH